MKSATEEYLRQQNAYVQSFQYAPSLQSVGGNSTHDMNKQVQTAPTGPYASIPPGPIPGTAPHHQQGLSGPVPSQSTSMVPTQGQQLNTRPQMTNLSNIYSRQNPSRQMHNMPRPQLSSVVNQPNPQASQQYGTHMSMFPSHASYHLQHQGPMLMQSTVPVQLNFQAQRQQFTAAQQPYALQPSQVYLPSGSWNQFNQVYYPQIPSMAPCPSVSHMQPVQPPPAKKSESKAVAIINPETGKNILDEMDSSAASSRVKDSNQPDESDSQSLSTLFAAQVAATLAPDNEKSSVSKVTPEERANNQLSTDSPSEGDIFANTIDKTAELDGPECYSEDPLIYSPTSTQFYNKDLDVSAIGVKSLEEQPMNNLEIDNSLQLPEVPKSTDLVYCAKDSKNYSSDVTNIDNSSVQEPVVNSIEEKDIQISSDIVDVGNEITVEECSPVSVHSVVMDITSLNSTEDSQTKPITQIQNQTSHKLKSSQNGETKDTIIPVTAISKEEKLAADVGKKSKKKKIELNKKGESKEGGDMDAFLDKHEDVPLVATVPVVEQPQVSPIAGPITESIPPEEIILSNCTVTEDEMKKEHNDLRLVNSQIDGSPVADIPSSGGSEELSLDEQPKNITLKYSYKEDQWSPLNPEGKKQYDREFLLTMQSQPMSMQKPLNLPNLEVIKDKAVIHRLAESGSRGAPPIPTAAARAYTDLFLPQYTTRSNQTRPPHPNIGRRSQQGRNKPPRVITLTSSLNQAVKLHEADNAWKPTHKAEVEPEDLKTQLLFKKVRGILNKLTPQKFTTLVGQVKQLEITTEESLNGVIDLVFEKALDEPNFSVPYANMCKQLALLKVPSNGQEGQFVNFRKLLLTKCQKEFEKDRSDKLKREERMKLIDEGDADDKRRQLMEEFEDEERRNRRRQLGNIRFIGELFKLGMLIEPIMHQCIKTLLTQGDEDSIECLCRLLQTIGKELDQCKKSATDFAVLEGYFSDIRKIIDTKLISSRVRFMLQDIMDLRQKNWIPRRDENLPKTIDQIHKEAEREAQEQQERLQQMPYPKRMPDDRDRRSKPRNPNPNYDDGWITSSKSSKGNYSVDPSKLKLTKPTEVENIQLGPGMRGFSSWGRGSSGGGTKPNPDQDSKSAVLTNRYSALAEQPSAPMYEARRGSQRSAASSRESSRGRSNQLAQSSIRKTPSTSKERESLLETVKGLALARTGATEVKPSEVKKVPESRNVNGKPIADNVLKGPEISNGEEMEKKARPLIDEYFHNQDLEEAVRCITELTSGACIHMFISAAINIVLERSSQSRCYLGTLFYNLLKREVITVDHYNKGLQDVLEMVDDYALDIPKIWDYLAEIMEPVVEGSSIVPLSSIKVALKPCIPSQTAGKLVAALLHCAAKKRGTIKVGEMWRESGLEWDDFLPTKELESFLQSNKLEFTINEAQPVPQPEPLTFEDMKKKLSFYMQNNGDNEEVFDWIESHVGQSNTTKSAFLRALVTSVFENAITGSGATCELDIHKVKARMPVLQRYLDHNDHLELQALYALQSLMNKLDHPKGMLKQIFDVAYDDDLISEDAFKQWEESQDPAEREGKGVAIHGVASFLLWLKEAEEESEVE